MNRLKAFVSVQPPHTAALHGVNPAPQLDVAPEIWMLGSTEEGAKIAAHFGLPFSFAHFISPHLLERACEAYRTGFVPSDDVPEPEISVGVFVLCADTEEEANDLALCRDLWRYRVERGRFEPFPTIAEAKAHEYTEDEQAAIASKRKHQIIGTKERVGPQLSALAASVDAGELSVISITSEFAQRVRCYELLAEVVR